MLVARLLSSVIFVLGYFFDPLGLSDHLTIVWRHSLCTVAEI